MRRKIVPGVVLSFFLASMPGFSQTSNAQLTGTVTDQTGALIPGVTITLTKSDTGRVTTALSNEAGVYIFQGVQPGSGYSVSAALPGFQTLTYTNLDLGAATVVSRNFSLQVATQATKVEVSVEGLQALTETQSIGDVLPQERIKNLPLVGNNVLDLLNILPGVRFNGTGVWLGDYANTVAGQGLNSLNVTLDGLPTRDERFSAQAGTFQGVTIGGDAGGNFGNSQAFFSDYTGGNNMLSTTTLNPELVGEIRLILSPVDAELGRGNSQIQMTTRSGTNRYSGSVVWNIQNTSLNPNTWNANNDVGNAARGCKIEGQVPPCWNPTQPNWRNTHEYSVSYGGPIVRNKTFFFVLWDQQISRTRQVQNVAVLTDTARNGVFRYWQGWAPGRADVASTPITQGLTQANPTTPSVDALGNPVMPLIWPNGSNYNGNPTAGLPTAPAGNLVCFSIFGTVKADGSPFGSPSDCDPKGLFPGRVLPITPGSPLWDPKRPTAATAAMGYFAKLLQQMPRVNDFTQLGDGLNTARFTWLQHRKGDGSALNSNALVGSALYQDRKQINVKIDQNFGKHRLAGNWTHQIDSSEDQLATWPNGLSGETTRHPHIFTVNLTSTLSPSMLNEGRFGININKANTLPPWLVSDSSIQDTARSYMLSGGARNGNTYPVLVSPNVPDVPLGPFTAVGGINVDGGLMTTAGARQVVFNNPLYDFSDTFSWSHGKHSFKFGADFRYPRSEGNSLQPFPVASYGNLGGTNTESPFALAGTSPSLGSTGAPSAANCTTTSTTTCPWAVNLFPQSSRYSARSLAYLLTDSLRNVNTPYWAENFDQVSAGTTGWQDVTIQGERNRRMVFNDYSFFVKDDFKVTRDLTLNLGVRYEYYAPPYITSGLTSTVVDQGDGLFGVGRSVGASFDNWLYPGNLYFTGYGTNGTGPGTNGLGSSAITLACSKTAVGTFASRLPAPNCDPSLQSNVEFIGPNSPNPDKTIIPRDRNNFGPAIGFAWQVPWFGQGKTTVRGGYQVTFQRVSIGEGTLASALGGFLDQSTNENDPAVQAIAGLSGQNRAVLLSDLPALVPVPPSRAPGQTVPVYGRSQTFTAFDPNFATPYTQNLTLNVTRQLTRQLTLDLRYIGSLSRKLPGTLDLNTPTAMYNQELFDAFASARKGGNPPLLDQMLAGLDLAPGTGNTTWTFGGNTGIYPTDRMYGPVGTCTTLVDVPGFQTPAGFPDDPHCAPGQMYNSGAEHLRRAAGGGTYNTADELANGFFAPLAQILASGTTITGGLQPITTPVGGTTPSQRVLRNGCDRIANGLYDSSAGASYPTVDPVAGPSNIVRSGNLPTRCFPENYLVANPQLNSANYNANLGRNNYHSMEVQLSMRPRQGVSFQASYTWAKSMGVPTFAYNDPLNRNFDRQQGIERKHDFRLNGNVELPFGPNKLVARNSSGWVARVIEGWQIGYILNMSSGSPQSITGAGTTRYSYSSNFQPYGNAQLVPTQYWKVPKGKVEFGGVTAGNAFGAFGNNQSDLGTYFGVDKEGNLGSYTTLLDPQCSDNSKVVQVDSKGFRFAADPGGCSIRALAQRVAAGTSGSFLLPDDPTNPAPADSAVYVLVNPGPGEYGHLAPNVLERFGDFNLDANIQKTFAISESKRLTLRIDATNVLNHPQPFIPLFTTNNVFITQFGVIECGCGDSKSGTRMFQGQVRLSF